VVLEFSAEETIGSFTGYYYLFSFTVVIVSPLLMERFKITLVRKVCFSSLLICFAVALVSMIFVNHGDTEDFVTA